MLNRGYVCVYIDTHMHIYNMYFVHALNLTFLWNQFYAFLLSAWATINYFGVGSYFLQAGLHFFWGTLVWFKLTFPSFLLGCEMLILTISSLPGCPWAFLNAPALFSLWNLSIHAHLPFLGSLSPKYLPLDLHIWSPISIPQHVAFTSPKVNKPTNK